MARQARDAVRDVLKAVGDESLARAATPHHHRSLGLGAAQLSCFVVSIVLCTIQA